MNWSEKREIIFRFVGAGAFSVLLAIFLFFSFGASAAEKVVLQLRWDHQFQFAGYYAALWQGYYADAGLEVEIRSGFGEDWKLRNPRAEVAGNHAEFGVTASDLLYSSKIDVPLVVLASIFQESPLMIYGLEGVKLDSPADLKGLRLGLFARGNIGETEIKIMLSKAGLDPERDFPNVTIIKNGLKDITEGRVDVAVGYSIDLNWFERLASGKLVSLKPSTYGVDFYGDTLFTRRSLVEQKPELVQAFVKASIKGWRYALIHGVQVADRIARDLPRRIPVSDLKEFNRSQIKPVAQLTHFPVVPLGHRDPERWRRIHASLKSAGLAKGQPPGRDFVYDPEREARNLQRTMMRMGVTAGVLVLTGILAGIAWIIFLRRAVAARTRELANKTKMLLQAERLAGLGHWALFVDTGELYWSDEVYRIHGIKVGSKIDVDAAINAYHPDDRATVAEYVRRAIEEKEDYDFVLRLIRADDEIRYVHSSGVVHLKPNGVVDSLFGVFHDITEQRRIEERIQTSLAEKEVLLKEVHHRVKNNLQVISSMLSLQAGVETDSRSVEVLKDNQRRIKVMARIHENLHQSEDLTSINTREYLSTVVEDIMASSKADKQAISSRLDVEDIVFDLDHAVACGQIVSEVLSNSLKHAFPDGRSGNIDVSLHRRDGERIELSVADDGKGLPEGFDPQQTETLGMRLIHALAMQLSGVLQVDGSGGTRISITFPEKPS